MNKTIDALKLAEEAANRVIETLEYLKTIGIHPASLAPAIRAEKKALAAIREALVEQAPIQSWFGVGAAWPEKQEMISAAYGLSSWLSAALDDPKVCQGYKDAINAWFDAAMPVAPSHREINESIHDRQVVIRTCVSLIREEMGNVPQLGATWLKLHRLIGEIEDMGDEPVKQEPVVNDADRSDAYDVIDRFLRNNLDDSDYKDYSTALDTIYAAPVKREWYRHRRI